MLMLRFRCRMEDPRVILHEAPSAFEIVAPACEGWVLLRRKTGVFMYLPSPLTSLISSPSWLLGISNCMLESRF